MTPDELKTWAEIFQSIVTTFAIIIAGIWSYYTFVKERTFAPKPRIQIGLKQVTKLNGEKVAIVSVTMENIGRIQLRMKKCYLAIDHVLDDEQALNARDLSRIDKPLDLMHAKVYSILSDEIRIEPVGAATQDVLLSVGDLTAFKASVVFFDKNDKQTWSASTIIIMESSDQI
jgi:hypothetical protein